MALAQYPTILPTMSLFQGSQTESDCVDARCYTTGRTPVPRHVVASISANPSEGHCGQYLRVRMLFLEPEQEIFLSGFTCFMR